MKKRWSLFFLLFTLVTAEAQFRVVFKLNKIPAAHTGDHIFIAGNFNSWDPGNVWYAFSATGDNMLQLPVQLSAGDYEFKCTRGNWQRVEVHTDGSNIENRTLSVRSDTTIELSIEAWQDDIAAPGKKHTANSNVQVMDTAFRIPQLDRTRRVWIYLPDGYANGNKRYPVLYMHDGQNLFDAFTSYGGEWEVDERMDSLVAKGRQACIVVGIDNGGGSRFSEYNLFELRIGDTNGKPHEILPEGKQYIDFLVNTLKPYIDKKFRTLPSKENTLIAGSSMGALISYYAMLLEPDVFGKAGIFSPSFWTNPSIGSFTDSLAGKMNGKFFFYAGAKEGDEMVNDMQHVEDVLGAGSSAMIYSVIDPEGMHSEKAWRKWFAEFYAWVMADGFNYVVKTKE